MTYLRLAVSIALCACAATLAVLPSARAQSPSSWVQIEALPTEARAFDRAAAWSALFPDVSGFRLPSGWYALAIGPYERIEAQQRLNALRAEGMIPDDSYLVERARYGVQFWPVGQVAPQPQPQPEVIETQPLEALPGGRDIPLEVRPPVDETPAEARRSEAALSQAERAELQVALKFEGHYSAAIDGAFGPGTRAAMSSWQRAMGHDETGVLTTAQRAELLGAYRAFIASLGLAEVRDNTAGIAVEMPTALVEKGDYQPPFAQYNSKADSGVRVILISQRGGADALFGLYDILQTLEIVPTTGPRERRDRGFTIEGRDASIVTHAEARLTATGNIKGFILVWPLNDERRRQMALTAMQESFTPLGDSVLADGVGDGGLQDVDLLAGLQIRRPELSRSGFYLDARGRVLTTAEAVGSCDRVTLDGALPAKVVAVDAALGLALVSADVPLAPLGHARLLSAPPRLGSEIAVSGFAYDGRLGAPVVTFGRLADLRGLDGSGDVYRLDIDLTPGEAGAPVLDASGALAGMLLPPPAIQSGQGARQVLPGDVSFALGAPAIAAWLAQNGVTAEPAPAGADIPPLALIELARDITVQVACWN